MCTQIYTCTPTYIPIQVYTYIHTPIYIHIYTSIYTNSHNTHIHSRTYIHSIHTIIMHMLTFTNTCQHNYTKHITLDTLHIIEYTHM